MSAIKLPVLGFAAGIMLAITNGCTSTVLGPDQLKEHPVIEIRPHETSSGDVSLEGRDFARSFGAIKQFDHSVLLGDGQDFAWAIYSVGGFSPVLDLDTVSVSFPEFVTSPQTAVYVGLPDTSRVTWNWHEVDSDQFQYILETGEQLASDSGVMHLAVAVSGPGTTTVSSIEFDGADQPKWVEQNMYQLEGVLEPSGICLGPGSTSMFVVDDGSTDTFAGLAEVDFSGNVIDRIDLGLDLEGVCYCPVDGMLYVVEESNELVYIVNPANLAVEDSFYFSREFESIEVIEPSGDGIEGIEFIADAAVSGGGYFLMLNQRDPTSLVRINRGDIASNPIESPAPLSDFVLLEQLTAGALIYNESNRRLTVVHSWLDFAEVYDIDTFRLISREDFPGLSQEGALISPDGHLWVCYDFGFLTEFSYEVL